MATDKDGIANVVYVAGDGHRAGHGVAVRPYGIDANFTCDRTVEILQR